MLHISRFSRAAFVLALLFISLQPLAAADELGVGRVGETPPPPTIELAANTIENSVVFCGNDLDGAPDGAGVTVVDVSELQCAATVAGAVLGAVTCIDLSIKFFASIAGAPATGGISLLGTLGLYAGSRAACVATAVLVNEATEACGGGD